MSEEIIDAVLGVEPGIGEDPPAGTEPDPAEVVVLEGSGAEEEEKPSLPPEQARAEEKAMKTGWLPQEEWIAKHGGDRGWKSAPEYNRHKGLVTTIKNQGSQIERQQADIDRMKQTYQAAREVDRQRLIKELKADHAAALEDDDTTLASNTLDEIEKATVAHSEERMLEQQAQATPSQTNPVLEEWASENSWFIDDPQLQAAAMQYGEYLSKTSNAPKGRAFYDTIADSVRRNYPDKFGTSAPVSTAPAADAPNLVRTRHQGGRTRTFSRSSLPEDLKPMFDKFRASGIEAKSIFKDWHDVGLI